MGACITRRYCAVTKNGVLLTEQKSIDSLSFKASHDELTGAYNRAGYELLLPTIDWHATYMLLFDVDQFKGINDNGRMKYPLGRIIPYGNYLLLAFSHFGNQKNAYLGIGEYEQLLFRMWSELRRVYAAKRISIPLLGTGITSIEGLDNKNYTAILRCILCTFHNSNFQPAQGITIVMTSDAMRQIDMDIIKEEF